MTLRLRFNLLITLIMLFLIIVLASVIMSSSKRSIQEGVESANKVTIQLLETIIVSSVQNPDWGNAHDVMHQFLRQLGYVRSNDIFLYNHQGELTYRSPPSSYLLEVDPPKWYINFISPKKEKNSRLINFGKLIPKSGQVFSLSCLSFFPLFNF